MPQKSAYTSSASVNRRSFIHILVGVFSVLWGMLALYPVFRYLRLPKSMTETSTVTRVTLGQATSIPVGQSRNFQFGSIPAVIIRTGEQEFHAFNAVCTHLGCTVQYRADMQRIWCACHGGQYDRITGDVLAGPPPRPLEPLVVSLEEGNIIVGKR